MCTKVDQVVAAITLFKVIAEESPGSAGQGAG